MKNLLKLLVMVLLAAFVLPSCNSSLSITKRRYTKGYYVQHNSGKHQAKKESTASVRSKAAEANTRSITKDDFLATEFVKRADADKVSPEKKDVITAGAQKKSQLSKERKQEIRDQVVELAIKHPVKALKLTKQLAKSAATEDDALSLLWIVVVVILIVYLLGILLDWGSGSGLIHILGIIALVLLILWLLRIL